MNYSDSPVLPLRFLAPILLSVFGLLISPMVAARASSDAPDDEAAPSTEKVDFKSLKSPVPYTKKSIARGRMLYVRHCTECHGPDGKALMDVIADATDLTSPKMWLSGTTEGENFRSIRDGAGVSMPPFSFHIKREEDMWHLVNYVQSLWPKSDQPQLQEESGGEESNNKGRTP